MSETDPVAQIEQAVLALVRKGNDPRGNRHIYELAGTDIERSSAVLLARLDEIQPARLSDLAAAVGIETSTASRQVTRLVEQGYVERTSDPADGRAVLHRLSPAGRDLRRRLRQAVRTWLEQALTGFDAEDRQSLADLLSRFVDHMTAEAERDR